MRAPQPVEGAGHRREDGERAEQQHEVERLERLPSARAVEPLEEEADDEQQCANRREGLTEIDLPGNHDRPFDGKTGKPCPSGG
jgi:hypothetical protein